MDEDTGSHAAARPGRQALSALCAAGGTIALSTSGLSLVPTARAAHGGDALVASVLVLLAALGAVLCLYLTLIWFLATLVLLIGPASLCGAMLLAALRVLAPRVARRLTVGAAVATTATSLVLAPAMAADISSSSFGEDPGATPFAPSAELLPADGAPSDPDTATAAPGPPSNQGDSPPPPLPPLGWGDGAPPSSSSPRTVIVHPGDTLWSITDDLLGPAPDNPSAIAASWPVLHDANRVAIGEDPDHLVPGQELTVPTTFTSQDTP